MKPSSIFRCETIFPFWPAGTFVRAYAENRRRAIEDLIEADPVAMRVREIMAESCEHLDLPLPDEAPEVWGDYIGPGYGIPTELSKRALETVAFSEGILLDPVYTAKAFGGLIGEIERGRVKRSDSVIFVHTGGTPALFADPSLYWHAD